MTTWNNLLASLDATFGFPTGTSSTVKKLRQGFDNSKQEHVIWIEYRVKVNPGSPPKRQIPKVEQVSPAAREMQFLRELIALTDY